MCINIGALVGGIVVPIVAQHDVTLAYTYPPVMLGIGIMLFLMGTPRYVRHPPSGDLFSSFSSWSFWKFGSTKKNNSKKKKTYSMNTGLARLQQLSSSDQTSLMTIFRVSALVIPFNIAYSQMATTFIIQGTVMKKAFGFIDAASMNNADAVAVLVFGHWVGSYMYPALARRGIKIPTTYKFALGSGLGALAIAWALYVEYLIHTNYVSSKQKVNIMWQALSYVLIGAGEIFAVSAAYEVAFTASPPEKKALASALNLFCVGGIPNVLCICLYNACRGWFRTKRGTISIHALEDYASAQVYKYFLVLFGISLLGIVINLLPAVRNYVVAIEEKASDMVKTPVMKRPTPRVRQRQNQSQHSASTESSPVIQSDTDDGDEESPLLRAQRHQAYLKYGSGPVLYKSGSMRAGPSLGSNTDANRPSLVDGAGRVVIDGPTKSTKKTLKKSQVGHLYRISKNKRQAATTNAAGGGSLVPSSQRPNVVMTPEGKPMKAGNLNFHNRQGSM
jgi:POT family proton-dependent oligopeptide transporter